MLSASNQPPSRSGLPGVIALDTENRDCAVEDIVLTTLKLLARNMEKVMSCLVAVDSFHGRAEAQNESCQLYGHIFIRCYDDDWSGQLVNEV